MTSANAETLGKVLQLWDKGELDKAMDLLKAEWRDHPDDPRCIGMAAHIFEKANNLPLAYNLFKLAKNEEATESSHWLNYGRCAQDLWKANDAERAYNRAMTTTNRQSTKVFALGNLAAMHIDFGRFTKAEEYISKALKLDPESPTALANLGFVQLAKGDWENGWKNYRNTLGTDWRKRVQYGDEYEWDGSPGQSVAFYGEQGIGDEICFASLIDELTQTCRKAIIECDYRLENLYKRSFPQATIYGTRHKKRPWAKEDREIDASFPIGQACEFLRKSPHDCPQTPYLVADPERVEMWKALWAKKGKPVIGIAWAGGIIKTGEKFRHASLDNWADMLELDAHFVSLQYKGDESHPKVHEYRYATRTQDYDDTAALVASLDLVVSVPTAAVHLAGALGKKVIAMHGPMDCWKYACGIPFHPAEHVMWQGDWKKTISAAASRVKQCLESSSVATPGNPSLTTSLPTASLDMPLSQSA